ncbi:MAG: hypothetical protein CEE40_04280 [Chloroflexi bacterium B3_Chlor]|nr:MAG: hypothetical protein CEE40_04280 [Chloroflexi bacterium B3_Chlor]
MAEQLGLTIPFSKKELVFLLLIMLVASFLRLYRLDEVPPGLHGDTAYKGVAANRILRGEAYPIFFEESWGGVEPMYLYLLAASFHLFGNTPQVIQGLSAAVGIITVPLLYLLARELLRSRLVGLLASFWLATSYWHVSWSRLGWESILVPPFVIATVWLLWRALEAGQWRFFIGAGVSLGLSLYTYQGMRFLPIFLAVYLGYRILTEKAFWQAFRAKLTLFALVALLVFLPLGGYYVTHPDTFLRRAGEVSIFNPEKNPHGPLRSLVTSAAKIVGMYNLRGDRLWRHNIPGRPVFDPLTSVCFLLGVGVSVMKWRESAYSLLLFWLVVMSLPPVLTPPYDVPHFTRSIGALPAACMFPAIAVQSAWLWIRNRDPSPRVRRLFWAAVSAILVTTTVLTYRDYFVTWAGNDDLRDDYFDGQFLDLGTAMNELDGAGAVWILPISALASPHDDPGHHTVEFTYRGQAPFHFLRLDEATAPEELSHLVHGHTKVLLVDYKNYTVEQAYKYIDADPKQLAPFLLGKYGQKAEQSEFDSFDVLTYELPGPADFAIAGPLDPVSARFDDQLMLTGFDYGLYPEQSDNSTEGLDGIALPSGSDLWVVLRWQSLAHVRGDYKVAIYLLDERERVAGQVDKILLSNHMRLTSDWEPGQVETDYYVLPSLPATAPGSYHIGLAVYDPATMHRLVLQDSDGNAVGHIYRLAEFKVVGATSPKVVHPQREVEDTELVPEVRLMGYDLPRKEVSPGDALEMALYWEVLRDVQADYAVQVQLRDDEGHVWAEEESKPAYGGYPTTQWQTGEIIRDWHDVPIGVETPDGDYHLYLGLAELEELRGEVELETIRISGRVRSFEIPDTKHQSGWRLGEGVVLLGYDVDETVRAGDAIELILYWQCVGKMDQSYTVFTHLPDEANVIRGQKDSVPADGEAPTSTWVEGEVISDGYEILLDAQAPAGEYEIEIGMYDADTMQRLPVYDAQGVPQGDRILLATVQVLR